MKECNVCHESLADDRFSPSTQTKDGRMATCKDCRNTAIRARYNQGIYYVYALVDPFTEGIRYVGRTTNPDLRLKGHISDARQAPWLNPKKANWINTLISQGVKPRVVVIEQCDKDTVCARERYWIEFYRETVSALLNGPPQ